jgi:hypothetical protein
MPLFPFFFACTKKKPNPKEESAWVTLRDWPDKKRSAFSIFTPFQEDQTVLCCMGVRKRGLLRAGLLPM